MPGKDQLLRLIQTLFSCGIHGEGDPTLRSTSRDLLRYDETSYAGRWDPWERVFFDRGVVTPVEMTPAGVGSV